MKLDITQNEQTIHTLAGFGINQILTFIYSVISATKELKTDFAQGIRDDFFLRTDLVAELKEQMIPYFDKELASLFEKATTLYDIFDAIIIHKKEFANILFKEMVEESINNEPSLEIDSNFKYVFRNIEKFKKEKNKSFIKRMISFLKKKDKHDEGEVYIMINCKQLRGFILFQTIYHTIQT